MTPTTTHTPTEVNLYYISDCFYSLQSYGEYITKLAYRYNTGMFLVLDNQEEILEWLENINYMHLPPIYTDIIVMYGDNVVEHYVNKGDGSRFTVFKYEEAGFKLGDYIIEYSYKLLTPADKMITGPIAHTYWFARTLWEAAKEIPELSINSVIVRQLYDTADGNGVYDDFNEKNFYNANNVVNLYYPVIAVFNPNTNWYDIVDGYHRLYKAHHTKQTLLLKSLEAMPEPDFVNGKITDVGLKRIYERRHETLLSNCQL